MYIPAFLRYATRWTVLCLERLNYQATERLLSHGTQNIWSGCHAAACSCVSNMRSTSALQGRNVRKKYLPTALITRHETGLHLLCSRVVSHERRNDEADTSSNSVPTAVKRPLDSLLRL